MIYFADLDWFPTNDNPFTSNGEYGANWSAFIYDNKIESFTNVYNEALLYVLRFSPSADKEHIRLFDFLYYESIYGRNVIIKLSEGISREKILEEYDEASREITFRVTDENYMVHSTPLANWNSIQNENALLSPNILKNNGKAVTEIGIKDLLEPLDYSDYVMLGELEGCSENVVNSRQKGYVCIEPDSIYTPGVRLYFDTRKIINDKISVRDGLHLLKVKDRLPLKPYLVKAITTDNFIKDIVWTPSLFTKMANELFFNHLSSL